MKSEATNKEALVRKQLEKEIAVRKQMQADLLKKEEWFRALIEKSFDAVSLTDKDAKIIYVSPSFTKVLGYSFKEMVGTIGFSLVYPDDIPLARTFFTNVLTHAEKSSTVELRCHHKDGTLRYIEVVGTNLLDNPNVGAIVFNFHDVSEQRIIQETLAKEKAEAEAILASIGEGLIVIDKEGKIELLNHVAEGLLGWKMEELLGKPLITALEMDDEQMQPVKESDRPLAQSLVSGEQVAGTYFYHRKDRTKFPVSIMVTPLIISGQIVGSIEVFRDITREMELDQAKDEFISLASHELRTPMTAIKGLVDMILHGDYGPVNDDLKKPLTNINLSSDRQIHLINDLLDISRMQTGRITYRLVDFSLKQVLSEMVETLQPIARQKNSTLLCKEIPDTVVQADMQWVKQIVNNLVGNALKFTEKGEVSVSTRVDNDFALVVVVDTGIGIAEADKDKLFERFRQLGPSLAKKYVGSGLGLYISRELARKMGGDIILEHSEVGKGSSFVFSIPKAGTAYAKKVKDEIQKEVQIAFDENWSDT